MTNEILTAVNMNNENTEQIYGKKVSIIIPVYKSEMFLEKLIESIRNQTYSNVEIILVDDGSPDNSGAICDCYARKDNRIKVIHKENGGTCEARNVGLRKATGDLLMFADGDDWLEKDCVEYLVRLINDYGAEMAMTDSVFSTRDRIQNKKDNIRKWTKEQAVCGILYADIPIGPWNKIYTTRVIKDNNLSFSVPWFGEGLYFSVMAAQYSNFNVVGHRKIYNYRRNNPNSGTTVRNVQHGINALNNIKYIKDKLLVKTTDTVNSANWHIWKNYFNLIMFIIGANAINEYKAEYELSQNKLRSSFLSVFLKSKVSLFQKIFIIGASFFPVTVATLVLWKKKRDFNKDKLV